MLVKNITSFGVVIYLITALSGYQIGWSFVQYDELRLLQLPLALCALIILIFVKRIDCSIYTQINFFIIGVLILTQQINWEIFEFQELWSAIALLFIFSALTYELRNIKNIEHGIALVVVTAIIPCLFILISIFNFIIHQQWFDWQFNSGTIRIYDSVIVPLFFFLINLKNKKYPLYLLFLPYSNFLFCFSMVF